MMIPIGFRFDPTDEELLRYYLIPWVLGHPLPSNFILYKSIYGPTAAPWLVFVGDDVDNRWDTNEEGGTTKSSIFIFTNLTRVHNSKRISRTSGGGTWGGQTGPKEIFSSDTHEVIGHKRMLSFEHPDCGASSQLGHWIMHEYVLSDKILKDIGKDDAGDMVVCKITRCFKNSGRKRRQQQFFTPAVANVQESEENFARCKKCKSCGGSDTRHISALEQKESDSEAAASGFDDNFDVFDVETLLGEDEKGSK